MEEAAAKQYELKRARARKKKEAQQHREMQQMLEERRTMEEELEELRLSTVRASSAAASASALAAQNGLQGTTAGYNVEEMQQIVSKKLSKMKKRYEKKLSAAQDDLRDLQEVNTHFFTDNNKIKRYIFSLLNIIVFFFE